MAVAPVQAPVRAEQLALFGFLQQGQATAAFQQAQQFRDIRGAVAGVGLAGALPLALAGDVACLGEQQTRRLILLPGGEQAAGMVEVQVGEHHDVDVGIAQAQFGQAVEQYMAVFLNAEAVFLLRAEEGTDTGFHQDIAPLFLHQQGAAAEVDTVLLIRGHPALPKGLGGVAEHGAAVEFLAVAGQGGQGAHGLLVWRVVIGA